MSEQIPQPTGEKEPFEVRFKRAWENYWYLYKWQTWIAIVVVVCVALFVGEKLTQVNPDVYITYIGSSYIDETLSEKINQDFADVITDTNGDGEKIIQINTVLFNGSEDLLNMATLQKADIDLMSGRSVLYLIDSFAYETFIQRGAFREIETAQGEFSYIDLTSNRLLNSEEFHFDNVYLCQRQQSFEDKDDEETRAKYENAAAMVEKILQYQ